MKLARCSDSRKTFWAVVDVERGRLRPIAGRFEEWAATVTDGGGEAALALTGEELALDQVRLLPPIEPTAKVIVAGANYLKHLVEFGIEPPKQPFAFMKPYGALIGANDDIVRSPLTEKLDYEVELVAVVGKPIAPGADPARSVLGYTIGNDVSARDLQKGPGGAIGMDFLSGKGLDCSTPVGPWIVTRDEFGDATPALRMVTRVNGEARQDGSTGDMRWNVGELLAYLNARSAMLPGDIMFTGTPDGIGQSDGRFLNVGDVVEVSIDQLGTLRNKVVWPAA